MQILIIVISYLVGSISSSIIVCKLLGLPDLRNIGSKNAGATNMLRIGGKKVAAIVLLIDIFKGFLVVIIAKLLAINLLFDTIIGLSVVIGHIYPVFFNFKGGKGVATFIGVLFALNIYSAIGFIVTWLIFAKIVKKSSLAALLANIITPILFYLLSNDLNASLVIGMISIIILLKHTSNIKRLISGKEDNIKL